MCVIRDSVGINLRCIDGRWTINGIQLRWSRKTHCSTGQFTVVTNTSQKTQSNDCPLHSRLGTMFSYHPLIWSKCLHYILITDIREYRQSNWHSSAISILDHINSEFLWLISCNYEETNNEAKKKSVSLISHWVKHILTTLNLLFFSISLQNPLLAALSNWHFIIATPHIPIRQQ